MRAMTRRTLLELSAGVLGASVFGARVPAQAGEPARINTVFFEIAPSRDDTNLEPITNGDIIRRLQAECGGVDFVVRDLTQGLQLQSVLNEAKDLKSSNYDGVIVCGRPRDYELLRTGLPTINVAVVNDFQNIPYPVFKQNHVIDASKIQRYIYPDKYGAHKVATCGDFRERIKDLATFIGFSVIEEDV